MFSREGSRSAYTHTQREREREREREKERESARGSTGEGDSSHYSCSCAFLSCVFCVLRPRKCLRFRPAGPSQQTLQTPHITPPPITLHPALRVGGSVIRGATTEASSCLSPPRMCPSTESAPFTVCAFVCFGWCEFVCARVYAFVRVRACASRVVCACVCDV